MNYHKTAPHLVMMMAYLQRSVNGDARNEECLI